MNAAFCHHVEAVYNNVISSLLLLVPAGWDPGELEDKRYVSISSLTWHAVF